MLLILNPGVWFLFLQYTLFEFLLESDESRRLFLEEFLAIIYDICWIHSHPLPDLILLNDFMDIMGSSE